MDVFPPESKHTAPGPVEITVIGKRNFDPIEHENEKDMLNKVLKDAQKFRESYPEAKINIELTEV